MIILYLLNYDKIKQIMRMSKHIDDCTCYIKVMNYGETDTNRMNKKKKMFESSVYLSLYMKVNS